MQQAKAKKAAYTHKCGAGGVDAEMRRISMSLAIDKLVLVNRTGPSAMLQKVAA
jgi:hypothetical protein